MKAFALRKLTPRQQRRRRLTAEVPAGPRSSLSPTVDDPWQNFAGDRRDELRALQKRAMAELFPHGSRVTGVAA